MEQTSQANPSPQGQASQAQTDREMLLKQNLHHYNLVIEENIKIKAQVEAFNAAFLAVDK